MGGTRDTARVGARARACVGVAGSGGGRSEPRGLADLHALRARALAAPSRTSRRIPRRSRLLSDRSADLRHAQSEQGGRRQSAQAQQGNAPALEQPRGGLRQRARRLARHHARRPGEGQRQQGCRHRPQQRACPRGDRCRRASGARLRHQRRAARLRALPDERRLRITARRTRRDVRAGRLPWALLGGGAGKHLALVAELPENGLAAADADRPALLRQRNRHGRGLSELGPRKPRLLQRERRTGDEDRPGAPLLLGQPLAHAERGEHRKLDGRRRGGTRRRQPGQRRGHSGGATASCSTRKAPTTAAPIAPPGCRARSRCRSRPSGAFGRALPLRLEDQLAARVPGLAQLVRLCDLGERERAGELHANLAGRDELGDLR